MTKSSVEQKRQSIPVTATRSRDDKGVLDAFVALAEAPDKTILQFARKFGALEICIHNLPLTHPATWLYGPGSAARRIRVADTFCTRWMEVQRTAVYRQRAARVRAVLNIAAALHRRGLPDERDVITLNPSAQPGRRQRREDACRVVESEVALWILGGRVHPSLRWAPDWSAPRLELAGIVGLYEVIGRQLAFAVAGVSRFAVCAGCGQAFTPKRRPREGERTWCRTSECRLAMRREATRDHRARRVGDHTR